MCMPARLPARPCGCPPASVYQGHTAEAAPLLPAAQVIFITEYMSSGSLKQFLKKTKKNHKTMNEKVSLPVPGHHPALAGAFCARQGALALGRQPGQPPPPPPAG